MLLMKAIQNIAIRHAKTGLCSSSTCNSKILITSRELPAFFWIITISRWFPLVSFHIIVLRKCDWVSALRKDNSLFILRGNRGFVKIPFRIAWGNHYCLCCKWQCLNEGYIMTGDRWWGDLEGECKSVKGRWDWSLWRGALTDLMEVLSTLASVSHRWCPSMNKDIMHLTWITPQWLQPAGL